jgi:prenylcysteine alpha-carboxyl methylesterase
MLLLDIFLFLLTVVVLSPGCVRTGWYYWISSNRQTVQYAHDSFRQRLDVYPSQRQKKGNQLSPTVIFFPGGAWLIGYKLWAALLARTLTAAGVTVVVGDYRNYPWATVPFQVQDVEEAIKWTMRNIGAYGGDAKNIVLGGESAGGHLACMALLKRALRNPTKDDHPKDDDFQATDFKGFVTMSTPNHLGAVEQTFAKHGWDGSSVDILFGGRKEEYNPFALVQASQPNSLEGRLPPFRIYHGSHDQTVPVEGERAFAKELSLAGGNVRFEVCSGWNHSRANVEGQMCGDFRFHRDMFSAVQDFTDGSSFDLEFPSDDSPLMQRLCPTLLCRLAAFLIPF